MPTMQAMNHRATLKLHRQQAGMSLIEVLVAMLVMALGILSMLAMQLNATKLTKTAQIRTMGAMLASDLADRMRANQAGFTAGNYALPASPFAPGTFVANTATAKQCQAAPCASDALAASDLADWLQSVNQALPNGTATISAVNAASQSVDLWLAWSDPQERDITDANATECPAGLLPAIATATRPRCMYFHINVNPN